MLSDNFFRKWIIILLILFIILVTVTFIIIWFGVDYKTPELWIGAGIPFIGFCLFYLTRPAGKIITLILTGLAINIFLIEALHWSAQSSLIASLVFILILLFIYMSLLS